MISNAIILRLERSHISERNEF